MAAVNSPRARPVSKGRPGVSPFQKGNRGATAPGAGATTTRSSVISAICQVDDPSTKVSPTRLSNTISSSNSPTRPPSGRTTV